MVTDTYAWNRGAVPTHAHIMAPVEACGSDRLSPSWPLVLSHRLRTLLVVGGELNPLLQLVMASVTCVRRVGMVQCSAAAMHTLDVTCWITHDTMGVLTEVTSGAAIW